MILGIDGDVLVYMSMWKNETLEEAKTKLDEILLSVLENNFTEEYLIALGGDTNWREDFYVDYKKSSSRLASKKDKPEYHQQLKEWLRSHPNAVTAHGFEADDLLRMWYFQAQEAGDPYIVCSIDKDLDCIPGRHYNIRKEEHYSVAEDYADHHYWKQILMGDAVDNIPGLKGVGPVKADKILADCKDHKDLKLAVINAYKEHYGDDWKGYLIANGRLIHIWRHYGDHFKLGDYQ